MCLMFDMREDGDTDPCKLAQMMQNLGVFISVKPKVKQTSKVEFEQVPLKFCGWYNNFGWRKSKSLTASLTLSL